MKNSNFKAIKKYVYGLAFSLPVFLSGLFAYDIIFDNDLLTVFDDLEASYTEIEFLYSGNEFAGLIFWQGTENLDDPVTIELEGETESLECDAQIRGLYLNTQRGNRLRPLDQTSLDDIRTIDDGSYDDLELTGGRYTECDGDDEHIYGQIDHSYDGLEYKLVAGVEFDGNLYNQVFDESSLRLNTEVGSGYFRDSRGGTFAVYGEGVEGNDTTPDRFSFPTERNADLDEYYMSDEAEIDGLSDGVQVLARLSELSQGALFINGDFVGVSGFVENGDEIEIELKSSDDYEEITSSTVYVGDRSATYYIITKDENDDDDSDLSMAEKIKIILTFKELISAYEGNTDKLEEFLYTFQSMLEDELDMTDDPDERAKIEYLLEVIDAYLMEDLLDDLGGDLPFDDLFNDNVYVAPNCKVYEVAYSDDRMAYYSPNFMYMHYFISEEAMFAYIDEHNPGNGNCGTTYLYSNDDDRTTRVAPNGKVYKIEKTNRGYTSYDFITQNKFFDSIEAIRKYIDVNNPRIEVWDHTVDEDFEAVSYTAPNGKVYEILKTDRGYMSYKFIFVKYFDTIEEIQNYIDANNPA